MRIIILREDIRYFLQDRKEPFSVEIAGKSWCDGSYRILREHPDIWVLEYIVSGTGTVQVNGKTYRPKAGDVYLLPPGKKHLYYSDGEDPWVKIFVNCRGPVVSALAEAYGLTGTVLYQEPGEVAEKFDALYGWMKDKGNEDKQVLSAAELLVHEIFRLLWDNIREETGEREEIKKVREYLDAHVSELVTIEEMARLIYRSPDYLIKHFKEDTGTTPYQYLLKKKMNIAKRLLKDTVIPVSEIGERLGYEDPHYFSGLFKKETGMPPGRYRREK